ncbi:aminopeptidase P N-terminal domain-containing protein [Sulfurimonas sp. SAG-AH-194-C21]|nr:aminopeptidase P N-terminal domain-containing protein [Sulfurimonas sp. SAG-AH-194-C21]MDF1882697.1 aminopeptidase P N-terminal domain-containing protein [Sulfurimonas sp. SAG-AH-194-C21]
MIKEDEYAKRRTALVKKLQKHSVTVFFSAKPKQRSNDTEYPYRQNSNFYYMCGFKEDNAALVIVKGEKKSKTYLFVQKKDELLELWTGKRLGKKEAQKVFDIDVICTTDTFDKKITELLQSKLHIYFDFSMQDERLDKLKKLTSHLGSHENIAQKVGAQRLCKSNGEIKLIKKALSITKEAHHLAMKKAKALHTEGELQAEIEYVFKKRGAYNDAYTSIVACGNNANTLHYIKNDEYLKNGELILIDAGCEYDYYASDITRTIPVSGKFTSAQKELYSMILSVEKEIIGMVKAGVMRSDLQKKSEELLCEGLVTLGVLKGDVAKLIKHKKHKKYYPHGIGHWMGIDVHDEAPYKDKKGKEIPLMSGMVMTVEPGIYIGESDMSVPKRFRGIGIRIEDDILVTKDSCENLSQDIFKEIKDIESL